MSFATATSILTVFILCLGAQIKAIINPPIYLDYADVDVFQTNGVYYLSASNMHMSPGAPLLCSDDLVHWEAVGASVPTLVQFDPHFAMINGTGYVGGTWASALRYRPSKKLWYWIGCIAGPWKTYVYTAETQMGPWKLSATIDECLYDVGLTIDDKDNMFVAYGHGPPITVAQLSPDGFKIVKKNPKAVTKFPGDPKTIEGSRIYFVEGFYYIFNTHPTNPEYVSRSKDPLGPYETRLLWQGVSGPLPGSGTSHQGGLVGRDDGKKPLFYGAFQDSFPAGRIPIFAPVTWDKEGWPTVQLNGKAWPSTVPTVSSPNITKRDATGCSGRPLGPGQGFLFDGTDNFKLSTLHPSWQFNHDPDMTKWTTGPAGLTLQTATVTPEFFLARNTLCRRIPGPRSNFVIVMDVSKMADGDRAGAVLFREISAYIGVEQRGKTRSLIVRSDMQIGGSKWQIVNSGKLLATAPFNGTIVYLRVEANVLATGPHTSFLSYSTDGKNFKQLGTQLRMSVDWRFYLGYQYCIFNHATKALGGSVLVSSAAVTIGDAVS